MLVQARYEDGSPMSERDLRDELLTLLTDGPTSTSLAWTFERLLRNPEKLARAQAEVARRRRRRLPRRGDQGDAAAAPAGAGRGAAAAGADAAGRPRAAGGDHGRPLHPPDPPQRGDLPAAGRFLPERFLDRPPGTYTWIPFGGGIRRCLAASYAEMEMKRVLRTVLSEVDLRPVESRAERMRKSAISFSPDRSGLVIAEPCAEPAEEGDRGTDADLLIVGAGAKAAAIATKVHVAQPARARAALGDDRRGDRARRLLAGPQRHDLGRGAAGGDPDQGHRLPLPEPLRVRRGGRRDRRGAMAFSWQQYLIGQAPVRRAGSTPARPRSATATTATT